MKVGNYSFPDHRLSPELIEAVRKIYDKFRAQPASDPLTVARLMGHKSTSGPFHRKLTTLREYGLLEKRGITVTELGRQLTFGDTEEDRAIALKEAILSIPLWRLLYTNFGANLPKDNFWVDLKRLTGLDAPDAQNLAESVRKEYIEDVKNIKTVEKPVQPPEPQGIQARGAEAIDRNAAKMETSSKAPCGPAIPAGDVMALFVPEIGAAISIKDVKTYKAAKIFWDDIAARWEKEIENQKKQPSDDTASGS